MRLPADPAERDPPRREEAADLPSRSALDHTCFYTSLCVIFQENDEVPPCLQISLLMTA